MPRVDADGRDRDDERQLRRGQERERLPLAPERTSRYSSIAGSPRTSRKSARKTGSSISARVLATSASRSSVMPLVTKKNGISRPKPTASSLGSNSSHLAALREQPDDPARRERAEDHVEPEVGGDDDERRTAAAP